MRDLTADCTSPADLRRGFKVLVVIFPGLWGPVRAILEMRPVIYYVLFDPIGLDLTDQNLITDLFATLPRCRLLTAVVFNVLFLTTGPAARSTRITRMGR